MAIPDLTLDIFIVIPVYNHTSTLRQVVNRVLHYHDHIVVVDDGSSQPVADVLTGLPIDLLRHPCNLGKGAALFSAANWGLRQGLTHMISLDADGQHDPDDLPVFFTAIAKHPQAVLVGHRDFQNQAIPRLSRFGRMFSNFWLRLQTGSKLKDSQSGFRAYPLIIFQQLSFQTRRYSFEVEVLVRAAWAGVELRDVDISVFYPLGNERISHFRGFMDNWRLTLLNTHLTFRSITPWPHRKISKQNTEGKNFAKTPTILHPLRLIQQLLQETGTPQRLAVAAGVGVFLGTLPLFFCHTIVILFACGYFRLNKIAAVSSSQLCMPPIVPALCIETGYFLRTGSWLTKFSLQTLGYQAIERLFEWVLGSLLLAPLLAFLVGGVTLLLAERVKKNYAQTIRG